MSDHRQIQKTRNGNLLLGVSRTVITKEPIGRAGVPKYGDFSID